MADIKSGPPLGLASEAPTATAHLTTSQSPSPATTAPLDTRPNKRKLDSEDGPTHKRLQVESPVSAQAVSPSQADKQANNSEAEGDTRHHDSPTRGLGRNQPLGPQGDSCDHRSDDRSTSWTDDRAHDIDNRYLETEDQVLSEPRQSPTAELSEANLKLLQQSVSGLEEMDNEVASSARGRKRTASRQTSNSDLASTRSKESAPSQSFYRYSILDQANVYIYPEPPPERLQAQLNSIFKRKVTEEKKRDISGIAKDKSPEFSRLLRGAHRGDDLVELVHETLCALHKDKMLTHPRKAGKANSNTLRCIGCNISR